MTCLVANFIILQMPLNYLTEGWRVWCTFWKIFGNPFQVTKRCALCFKGMKVNWIVWFQNTVGVGPLVDLWRHVLVQNINDKAILWQLKKFVWSRFSAQVEVQFWLFFCFVFMLFYCLFLKFLASFHKLLLSPQILWNFSVSQKTGDSTLKVTRNNHDFFFETGESTLQ